MEVNVRRYEISEIPSISNLSRFSDYRTMGNNQGLVDYLSSTFSNTGYFGSDQDRYHNAFSKTINYFYNKSIIAENDLKVAMGAISEINEIRICNTEESLRNIPPIMIEPITFGTDIYKLYRQNKIQGWIDYSNEELKENRKKWKRILDWNGVNRYNPEYSRKDQMSHFRIMSKSGDPELTLDQIDDINETREYVNWILENTDIDPTDMDELRN